MVSPERIYDLRPVSKTYAEPRLLVAWPSRWGVFFGNLRDLLFPRPQPRLLITSAPGIFWKDVFVHRPVPLRFIVDSYALHALVVLAVYFIFSSPYFFPQHLPARNPFANTTVEYYSVSEYLPPMRAASKPAKHTLKGQPAFAKQEIISVPPEPDNSRQTIVTPDLKVLSKDVPLPNMMVWGDRPEPIQPLEATASLNPNPKLFTPPDIIAPPPEDLPRTRRDMKLENSVIQPADENVPESRRRIAGLENEVIKPAPELPAGTKSRTISQIEPSVIAPPPTPDGLRRTPGAMNVGRLAATVSEPKMPVPEQRSVVGQPGGGGRGAASAGQPAPPAAPAAPSAQSIGGRRPSGQLIALSAQPAPVLGPIEIPRGSRRGVFAAGPNGMLGAPGTPNIEGGGTENGGTGAGKAGGDSAESNHGPEGVYVGPGANAPSSGAVVAAAPAPPPKPEPSFKDKLLGAMRSAMGDIPRPPAAGTTPPPPRSETKIEDKVFGDKKYYSMILNMPNLNSSAGSWIIRFAELTPTKTQAELSAPVALNKVDPAYPAELIRDKVEGTVVLYAVIRHDGSVDSVRVLQSVEDRLDQSAVRALQKWHFRPGTKQGAAVDIEAVVQIPFRVTKLRW